MLMVLLGSLEKCLNTPLIQLWDIMSKQQYKVQRKEIFAAQTERN